MGVKRGVAADDGERDDATLLEHCPSGGITLADGAEEAAENRFLLDGKAGCFEHAPGIVALAANDVGHRDLFGALRYRVGDGVAPVQDGALCGLLRDDLALCARVGERVGGRCGEAESFDRLLRGVRAHPVEGGYGERFASLGQDDVDGRVVRYRGTGRARTGS